MPFRDIVLGSSWSSERLSASPGPQPSGQGSGLPALNYNSRLGWEGHRMSSGALRTLKSVQVTLDTCLHLGVVALTFAWCIRFLKIAILRFLPSDVKDSLTENSGAVWTLAGRRSQMPSLLGREGLLQLWAPCPFPGPCWVRASKSAAQWCTSAPSYPSALRGCGRS